MNGEVAPAQVRVERRRTSVPDIDGRAVPGDSKRSESMAAQPNRSRSQSLGQPMGHGSAVAGDHDIQIAGLLTQSEIPQSTAYQMAGSGPQNLAEQLAGGAVQKRREASCPYRQSLVG